MSDSDDWEDYESGPFCRHYASPPSDCERLCFGCGHGCIVHGDGCDDCDCNGWQDAPEPPTPDQQFVEGVNVIQHGPYAGEAVMVRIAKPTG